MISKNISSARNFAGLAALSVLTATPINAATLMGDTVTATYDFTVGGYAARDYVVGPAVELSCGYMQAGCFNHNFAGLDFGANTISFSLYTSEYRTYYDYPFNGWLFTGLDFGRGIGGVTLTYNTSPSTWTGLSQSDISFTANSISLNLAGTSPGDRGWWTLTLQEVAPATVPLPAALPLGLVSMAALAGLKRRKRQQKTAA